MDGFVNMIRRAATPGGVPEGRSPLLLLRFRLRGLGLGGSAIGFELTPVEARVFRPEPGILGLGLLQCLLQRLELLLGMPGQMAVAESIRFGIGDQAVGPLGRNPAQMGTRVAVLALEAPGRFLMPSHSRAIPHRL